MSIMDNKRDSDEAQEMHGRKRNKTNSVGILTYITSDQYHMK